MNCRSRAVEMLLIVGAAGLVGLQGGCASLTNPTADGVPVRRVPRELLAPPHDEQTIPLHLLGQPTPDVYRLAPGDVLGLFIEGYLGDRNIPLPAYVGVGAQLPNPTQRPLPPSTGYPVIVEADGSIDLPGAALNVAGKSIPEVRAAIRALYVEKKLLKAETDRVLATLMQPRYASVLVLRQEATGFVLNADAPEPATKRGLGFQIDLPGYENDVLHALTRTGGLPGLDAYNEVIILRNCFHSAPERAALLASIGKVRSDQNPLSMLPGGGVVRIPLRASPGCAPAFHLEDVVLRTGDVLFLEARDEPYFYTAGLLPPGRHVIPRDHGIDVLEAIALVRGPLLNGAFGGSNLSGDLLRPGIGNPSPSHLTVVRRTPGGGQVPIVVDLNVALCDSNERIRVQCGDLLLLQEAPGDAFARWFTQTFLNFDLFWQVIHSKYATGVIDVSAPDRLPGRLGTVNVLQQ